MKNIIRRGYKELIEEKDFNQSKDRLMRMCLSDIATSLGISRKQVSKKSVFKVNAKYFNSNTYWINVTAKMEY